MVGAPGASVSAVPDRAVQTSQMGQRLLGGAVSERNEIVNFKLHATCIHAEFLQIEGYTLHGEKNICRKIISS